LGSIGELNYLFMGHSGDHVWTSFNTDKTHTEGEDAGYKRAFFHNPELPGSNFYFSLACHIFLTDRVAADGPPIIKVFSGKKTSKSFEKWLSRAFKTLTSDEQAVLGVLAELLGTHSFRKGGMTDAGGAIEGVPVTAVELRASHTLGGSKDPYYHATTNGDAAVGRYLAGLGASTRYHRVLPAHFHPAGGGISAQEWCQILPSYGRYPEEFRATALPALLAVLVRHMVDGDLPRLFPKRHPYLQSAFNLNRPHFAKLKAALCARREFGECKACGLAATGTSVMGECLERLRRLETLVERDILPLVRHVVPQLKEHIDARYAAVMEEVPGACAAATRDMLRNDFVVQGVTPVNHRDLAQMILFSAATTTVDSKFRVCSTG
jgi:hypothetical protein